MSMIKNVIQRIKEKFLFDHVVLCSPVNGIVKFIFSTGHAFGIKTNDGLELLVHCGIDTVNSNGKGFKILSKNREKKELVTQLLK